jgi:hypothetical protein
MRGAVLAASRGSVPRARHFHSCQALGDIGEFPPGNPRGNSYRARVYACANSSIPGATADGNELEDLGQAQVKRLFSGNGHGSLRWLDLQLRAIRLHR